MHTRLSSLADASSNPSYVESKSGCVECQASLNVSRSHVNLYLMIGDLFLGMMRSHASVVVMRTYRVQNKMRSQ